jgi:hypothetical protein
MPIYLYENPKTGEIKEIIQRMDEQHIYSEDNLEWKRVFSVPNANIDTVSNINPFSKQDFIKKTAKTGMTMGDMWDLSGELSRKREKKRGKDPVKEQTVKAYERKTGGKAHPHA